MLTKKAAKRAVKKAPVKPEVEFRPEAGPPSQTEQTTLLTIEPHTDAAAVEIFFNENPLLEQVVNEAYAEVRRIFGPDAKIKLQADHDAGKLFAIIQTSVGPDRAWELLQQLKEEWWSGARSRTKGKLILDAEPL